MPSAPATKSPLVVKVVLNDLPDSNPPPPLQRVPDIARIKQAKKNRVQQLKQWALYERQLEKEEQSGLGRHKKQNSRNDHSRSRNVVFSDSIVLLEASARDDVDEVRRLLEKGVSPDVANEDGLTALHQCCIDKSVTMCELLLQYGANVNSRDSELWTPLHAAATCGHLEICKILSKFNADFLAVNADGNMPYDICDDEITLDYIEHEMASRNITQQQIDETRLEPERRMLNDMQFLVKSRGDINQIDKQGATPLHIAASSGYYDVAEFLLNHNADLTIEDNDGWQAIHIAACWGYPEVIELLVKYGTDIDTKTRTGETVFDICEDGEMKDRLFQIKADQETLKQLPRNPPLTRKRSINNPTRSPEAHTTSFSRTSSIRRSSMRQKSMISRQEAKLEAEMRVDLTPAAEVAANAGSFQQNGDGPAVDSPLSKPPITPNSQHNKDTTASPVVSPDTVKVHLPPGTRILSPNSSSSSPLTSSRQPLPQTHNVPLGNPPAPAQNYSTSIITGVNVASPPLQPANQHLRQSQRQSRDPSTKYVVPTPPVQRQPSAVRASPPINGNLVLGDQPLKKFKSNGEEVICGPDSNTKTDSCKCCTVM